MNTTTKLPKLLIVSLTPYFLEKGFLWFDENLKEILQSTKTQSFFQDNILFLESSKNYNLMEILRKIDEMGYEKVFNVTFPGEFSQKGGLLEIFPINRKHAVRIDFLGNTIENIFELEISVESEEKTRQVLEKKLKSQSLFSDLKNLKVGDFLVHLDHGVGKFLGMEKLSPDDSKEYFVLEYAKDDKLFIPQELARKLSRYVGFTNPTVARLASDLWQRTKNKIKEDVEKMAKDLLALYAQKEVVTRLPYVFDQELEEKVRDGFLYQETPDQLQAIADIKNDLATPKPMDRIVCGDVGFGKTEIALRASGFAVANGYQTAIICPTTILANQHFAMFKKRLAHLPIRVALISRLQTKKEQEEIVAKIKEGEIDILIGTHRILSGDIVFKKLQMLIIDDEQRFGVKQKEKLRQHHPALDMLSLSATPIPRTIYLALSSFKNITLMQTPPQGRTAITTQVAPYSLLTIKEAIEFELARSGQVYFLHNRIMSIDRVKKQLEELVPDIKIGIIHGRLSEKEMLKVMRSFEQKEIQLLLATTIIENGIDLPSSNTIIIEDASRLGLAQAYQIRGRVGRSNIQSFAYLFYPKKMTEVAQERLRAIEEARELGAGYQIALRDLEIRGAGNILGREQSGSINKIGLNLYCQMLADSIEKLRN